MVGGGGGGVCVCGRWDTGRGTTNQSGWEGREVRQGVVRAAGDNIQEAGSVYEAGMQVCRHTPKLCLSPTPCV